MSEITLKLTIDGKEGIAVLKLTDAELLKIAGDVNKVSGQTKISGSKMVQTFADIKFSIEGIREAYGVLTNMFAEPMKAGAALEVLRESFKGTKEDLELYSQAVAGTVSEANLIKLSNQATALGLSVQQQAILMSLAEDAADKMGGSVQENFQKIVQASEGMGRGLRDIGIQTKVYEAAVKSLSAARGASIEKMDAETQKQIRLEAIIKVAGGTIDDVKKKTADHADVLEQTKIAYDDFQEQIGITLNSALIPLITHYTKIFQLLQQTQPELLGVAGAISVTTAALGGLHAVGILPLIINIPKLAVQLRYASGLMRMAAAEGIAAQGAMMAASTAAKGFFASIGPVGWAIIGLTALAEVWSLIASNTDDASKKEKEYLSQTNLLARLKEINKELENPNIDKTHKSLLRIERQEILKREIQTTYTSKDGKETNTNKDAAPDGILGKIKTQLDELEKKKPFAKSVDDLVLIEKKIAALTSKKKIIELEISEKLNPVKKTDPTIWSEKQQQTFQEGFVFNNPRNNKRAAQFKNEKETLPADEAEQKKIALIDNEYERQRALADFEYNLNVKKYGDLEILKKEHAARIREIDDLEASNQIAQTMNVLNLAAGALGQHTVAGKAAAIAMATINTYEAATKALTAGPIIGPILAGIITAIGLANVAKIVEVQPPKMQGYARGGIVKDQVVVGEDGVEIISGVQDYAEGQALLVAKTILAVDNNLRNMQMRSGGRSDNRGMEKLMGNFIGEIKRWQKNVEFNLKFGIDELYAASKAATAKLGPYEPQ